MAKQPSNSYQNYQKEWFNKTYTVNSHVAHLDDVGKISHHRIEKEAYMVGSGVYTCVLVKLAGIETAQHLDRCIAAIALEKLK